MARAERKGAMRVARLRFLMLMPDINGDMPEVRLLRAALLTCRRVQQPYPGKLFKPLISFTAGDQLQATIRSDFDVAVACSDVVRSMLMSGLGARLSR